MNKFKNKSIYSLLHLIFKEISLRRRINFIILFFLMLISSFAEIFSLTLVIPFLTILSSPEKISDIKFIQNITLIFGIDSSEKLILPITLIFIISAIFSSFLRVITLWLNGKLAALIGSDIGYKIYFKTLHHSYENYISKNSSELISALKFHLNLLY